MIWDENENILSKIIVNYRKKSKLKKTNKRLKCEMKKILMAFLSVLA